MKLGGIITDPTDIRRTMREYYEQFHVLKFNNLDEMNGQSLKITNCQNSLNEK